MGNWLKAVARTLGPRIIGAAAGAVSGWIFEKTRGVVTVDPDTLVQVGSAMLTGYAVAHRVASSVINPGDSAKGRLATAEKTAADSGGTVVVRRPE